MSNQFKPAFRGYLKIFLHENAPDTVPPRAELTEDWQTDRWRIMKKPRKFQITLHIFDKDGFKRGLETMVFTSKGGKTDITNAIVDFGNKFCAELRERDKDLIVDLTKSYGVVRA